MRNLVFFVLAVFIVLILLKVVKFALYWGIIGVLIIIAYRFLQGYFSPKKASSNDTNNTQTTDTAKEIEIEGF
jgi:hypothetical protein